MTDVIITSAYQLSPKTVKKIKKAIEARRQDSVKIKAIVNPEVIGGISLQIGSKLFDATVAAKLRQIKKLLDESL